MANIADKLKGFINNRIEDFVGFANKPRDFLSQNQGLQRIANVTPDPIQNISDFATGKRDLMAESDFYANEASRIQNKPLRMAANLGVGQLRSANMGLQGMRDTIANAPRIGQGIVNKDLGQVGDATLKTGLGGLKVLGAGFRFSPFGQATTLAENTGFEALKNLRTGKQGIDFSGVANDMYLSDALGLRDKHPNVSAVLDIGSNLMLGKLEERALGRLAGVKVKNQEQALRAGKLIIDDIFGGSPRTKVGSYTTRQKFVNNTRKYFKNKGDESQYAGALAGMEPYQDETGEWRVRFNPQKAVLGMAFSMGIRKVKPEEVAGMKQNQLSGKLPGDTSGSVSPKGLQDLQGPQIAQTKQPGAQAIQEGTPKTVPQSKVFQETTQQLKEPLGRSLNGDVASSGRGTLIPQPSIDTMPASSKIQIEKTNQNSSNSDIPYTNNITPPVKKLKVGNTTSEYNAGRIKTQNPEAVAKAIDDVAPRFEKVVGGPITRDQIKVLAETANERVVKTVGRGQAERLQASQLSLRKKIADLADATASGKATPKQIKELNSAILRDVTSTRSIAQQLSARNIDATPSTPEGRLLAEMLANIQKVTDDMDKVTAAMKGVDFSDANQATNFYRQFVKPTFWDWNTMLRYNSMLSSPSTHIVNATSNLQGTSIVAPIEKTITGALDWMGATVTGGPRKYYAGEGPAYAKGYIGSAGKAWDNFVKTLSGKNISAMQTDSRNIPLTRSGTVARVIEDTLSSTTKMLQATDEFFQTLTEGGVTKSLDYRASKGTDVKDLGTKAFDEGRKRLFNADIAQEGEGYLLDGISKMAGLIMQARNSKSPLVSTVSQFAIPFVRVATNIMKQGIEYSPAGVLTLPGNATKTEQLAKMLMGAVSAITIGSLFTSDRMTWATPTDPKKRALWESAGLQPYAVKIGDKWYSYSKLHPVLSFNFALVAAIKDAQANKRITENDADAMLNGFARWIQFQADQSYVKSISDLVAALQGDPTGVARLASNAPSQEIPFRGLLSWINRFIDDTQRRTDPNAGFAEKMWQSIAMQIPGLSQTVPARTDENGNPIKYTNKEINAISPIRVTTENSDMKALYDAAVEKSRKTKMDNDLKSMLKGEMKPADGINIQTSSTGARYIINGNELKYTDEEGSVKNIDLTLKLEPPKPTGNVEMNKTMMSTFKSSLTSQKKDVIKLYELGILTEQQAGSLINKIQSVYNAQPKTSGSSGGGKVSMKSFSSAKVTSLKAKRTAPIKLKAIGLSKTKSTGTVKLSGRQKRAAPKISEAQLNSLRKPKLS